MKAKKKKAAARRKGPRKTPGLMTGAAKLARDRAALHQVEEPISHRGSAPPDLSALSERVPGKSGN